jgi:hypothetical protein
MTVGVPFCDTPGQSVVVGVGSGLLGGGGGIAVGLGPAGVAALAGGLALVGDLIGHAFRGDAVFREASEQVRSWLSSP